MMKKNIKKDVKKHNSQILATHNLQRVTRTSIKMVGELTRLNSSCSNRDSRRVTNSQNRVHSCIQERMKLFDDKGKYLR